jgi:hypothetical protein
MTTQEIATKLAAFCREEKYDEAQKELYAENAISIEPEASNGFEKETRGLAAIIAKGKKFESMVEKTHSITVSEPLIAGNSIAFVLTMDMTMKGQPRMSMSELCVYQVKNGKIVSEQFFM